MSHAILDELFSLTGKVALVTGASSGIGRALAAGLASAGATVALNGRNAERLQANHDAITSAGGTAALFPAAIEELDAIPALLASVKETVGPVDILINCAGINQREPATAVTLETYDRIMNVNLRTPYFLAQAVHADMAGRGGGKIVNIGSLASTWGLGNLSVYGLTKSAIAQMTRTLAVEWAAENIQVNCICPGWIQTNLNQALWDDPYKRDWILARVPTGRPGQPSELVALAIYLCGAGSSFTTGQTFYVDGGFTAGGQW